MAEDNKLSKNEALHELYKGLTKQVEDFEKKCVALRKKELAKPAVKLAKNFPGVGGVGDAASPPLSGAMDKSEGCKLCGEKVCECDNAEKFAKGELKKFEPGPLAAKPVPSHSAPSHPDSFALKPAPQLAGPVAKPAKVQTMVERVASKVPHAGGSKLPGAHLFGKGEMDLDKSNPGQERREESEATMTKAGFKPGSPSPMSGGSAPAAMPPKPTIKPAAMGSVKPPGAAAGGAAKPPKAPALGAGQPNLKTEKK